MKHKPNHLPLVSLLPRLGVVLLASLLLVNEAQAQVRYDLYRGNQRRWLPPNAVPIAPNYLNSDNDFNTNYTTYMNNLINLSKTAGSSAGIFTSSQVYYPSNAFVMCDIAHYNGSSTYNTTSNLANAKPACDAQYQGYEGYTAILLSTPGTYKFSTRGNDALKIDQVTLTDSQAKSDNLDYKGLSYTDTTGTMRLTSGASGYGITNWTDPSTNGTTTFSDTAYVSPNFYDSVRFFSITVTQPTYLMLRMYWNNWGSDADFAIGWQPPGASGYSLIPSAYTCDPLAPSKSCFPDLAVQKTGPAYVIPSSASTPSRINYNVKLSINNSATGNTSTYGTTTLTDTLPTNLSWDSASSVTPPSGWNCSVAQQVLTCTTSAALSSAGSYTFALNNLLVATDTAAGSQIKNSASVSNPNESTDTSTQSNNSSDTTALTVLSHLSKSVSNSATGTGTTAYPGNTLHYCILAQNLGGADLKNYTITDPIDSLHLSNISAVTLLVDGSAVAGTTNNSNVLTTPAFTLAAGKSAQLCFDATVN